MKNTSMAKAFYLEGLEDFFAAKCLFDSMKKSRRLIHPTSSGRVTCGQRGSAFFMLLQMSAEKLAKAAFCIQQGKWPKMTHDIDFLKQIIIRIPKLNGIIQNNHIFLISCLMN